MACLVERQGQLPGPSTRLDLKIASTWSALLTTVTEPFDRVSMNGVRVGLLEAQAAAAGLPLVKVPIPAPCPNEVYGASDE